MNSHKTNLRLNKLLYYLAHRASEIIYQNFKLGIRSELKKDHTPITKVDTEINQLVINEISKIFPEIYIFGEEGQHGKTDAEYRILFDPLDGTIPYTLGLQVCSFCLALLQENRVIKAVIADPFSGNIWQAEASLGCFLRKNRTKVSAVKSLKNANICIMWWKGADYNLHKVCKRLVDKGVKWINPASVAIFGGLISSGLVDASIFPGRNSLETPAMQLCVEESGGMSTDIFGRKNIYGPNAETSGHIISNLWLHEKLVKLIAECQ